MLAVNCNNSRNIARTVITYGFHKDAMFRISNTKYDTITYLAILFLALIKLIYTLNYRYRDRHNILNSAAAIAVATAEAIEDPAIINGLKTFQGVGRRFEITGQHQIFQNSKQQILVIDDYGHHPTEIKAVINCMRTGYRDLKIIMVFQPHRYSRLRDFFDDFVNCLITVDQLIIVDVYAAGEASIANFSSKNLCKALRNLGGQPILAPSFQAVPKIIENVVTSDSIIITQGAGNITVLNKQINRHLQNVTKK